MALGFDPSTRLTDRLAALGCAKYVVVPPGTEKLCQLMAEKPPAPLMVVTVSLLPCWDSAALPTMACAPVAWARANIGAKPAASAMTRASGRQPAAAGAGARDGCGGRNRDCVLGGMGALVASCEAQPLERNTAVTE